MTLNRKLERIVITPSPLSITLLLKKKSCPRGLKCKLFVKKETNTRTKVCIHYLINKKIIEFNNWIY